MELKTNAVKAGICFVLLVVSAAMLFVPVVTGSEEIKGMFVLLTGIAVRDFFSGVQSDKRVADVTQALNPSPPESFVRGDDGS